MTKAIGRDTRRAPRPTRSKIPRRASVLAATRALSPGIGYAG